MAGDITHTRWGQHQVSFEGRTALVGSVSSAWKCQKPPSDFAVEVQVLGCDSPPAASGVKVLTASEALSSAAVAATAAQWRLGSDEASPGQHSVRRSLVLQEGEHVERICGEPGHGGGPHLARLEVTTNRGRSIAWPSLPTGSGGRPFQRQAAEFCEILGFSPSSSSTSPPPPAAEGGGNGAVDGATAEPELGWTYV